MHVMWESHHRPKRQRLSALWATYTISTQAVSVEHPPSLTPTVRACGSALIVEGHGYYATTRGGIDKQAHDAVSDPGHDIRVYSPTAHMPTALSQPYHGGPRRSERRRHLITMNHGYLPGSSYFFPSAKQPVNGNMPHS